MSSIITTSQPMQVRKPRPEGHRLVIRSVIDGKRVALAWLFIRADLSGGVADLTLPCRPPLRGLPLFPFERGARGTGASAGDIHRVGAPLVRNLVARSKDSTGRWRTFAWLCVRTDGLGGLVDITVPGERPFLNLPMAPLESRRWQ